MPSDVENSSFSENDIRFTPEFKRNLRALAKKYRHIRSDIQPIVEQLEKGQTVGDQVPGTGFIIYKVRVQNSDLKKGNEPSIGCFIICKQKPASFLSPSILNQNNQIAQPIKFVTSSANLKRQINYDCSDL
jgi:mRNA-degrading endonuclease RelE of RelBE toxin-antitoxin system